MKLTIAFLILSLSISVANAQRYVTKTGHIRFFSSTPVENIEANNHQVNAAIDSQTGDIVFKVLMKSFQFEKALMQEHFNENYVESDKYPNSTLVGKITNIKDIDFTKNGKYDVIIEGDLTIKDVTKKIKEKGTIEVNGDNLKGLSTFNIQPEDFNIKIPGAVAAHIAKSVRVDVDADFQKSAKAPVR
ncbi:MAG: YceI family protein [Omnitrophica WOR_2 bacterium]|jgi:polyisoprenoid-binding protein YceI